MRLAAAINGAIFLAGVETDPAQTSVRYMRSSAVVDQADGTKFGKTETGSVWLNAENIAVPLFISFGSIPVMTMWSTTSESFTWLDQDTITELSHATAERPHERAAQRRLAGEVTRMIHGESGLVWPNRQLLYFWRVTGRHPRHVILLTFYRCRLPMMCPA